MRDGRDVSAPEGRQSLARGATPGQRLDKPFKPWKGGSDCRPSRAYKTDRRRFVQAFYPWLMTAAPPGLGQTPLGDPADWKLIVVTPSKLVAAPVKFKLENIPLPRAAEVQRQSTRCGFALYAGFRISRP